MIFSKPLEYFLKSRMTTTESAHAKIRINKEWKVGTVINITKPGVSAIVINRPMGTDKFASLGGEDILRGDYKISSIRPKEYKLVLQDNTKKLFIVEFYE